MARGGFPNMPGGNMQQLMKQAQKMQEKMLQMQEELDTREYEASSGGGAVTVKVSGKRQVVALTIDKKAVDPDDVELLQDMVIAAANEALRLGEETREQEMNRLGGGMGGMF